MPLREIDRNPVDLDRTPRGQEKTDLALTLMAISKDLDEQGVVLVEQAAALEALKEFAIAQGDTQREILRFLRLLGPKLDRLDDIDTVRGQAARVQADLDRHAADPNAHEALASQ